MVSQNDKSYGPILIVVVAHDDDAAAAAADDDDDDDDVFVGVERCRYPNLLLSGYRNGRSDSHVQLQRLPQQRSQVKPRLDLFVYCH